MTYRRRGLRPRSNYQLPERLQRLNRELGDERTKDFDYLYAVHCGLRIRVCVLRNEDGRFFATTQLGKKAYRRGGGIGLRPSDAFIILMTTLTIAIAEMTYHERYELSPEMAETKQRPFLELSAISVTQ